MPKNYTLIPWHVAEGMSVDDAAKVAGKSARTIRGWAEKHGIGRRVGGGTLVISKVALMAFLEGDEDALISYRNHGVRASYPPVAKYFERADLGPLLELAEFRI